MALDSRPYGIPELGECDAWSVGPSSRRGGRGVRVLTTRRSPVDSGTKHLNLTLSQREREQKVGKERRMVAYLVVRVLQTLLSMLVVISIVFVLTRLSGN